ncbi:MAG: anti-sigma factor antagonist [Selenomonadaceae bacterium]|nr:anti-sigma factor antagonist [Selenomonadaceae bacterium]
MALEINTRTDGTSLTLDLSGELSTLEAKDFDAAFLDAAKGMKEALLDFSQVRYISSAGLRSLFLAKKAMMRQGGDLKVLDPTPEVMDVFKATRYDNIVTIVQREESGEAPAFYPLRPVQRMMVDTHFQKAESIMMNTGALIRMDDSVDMERLAAALNDLMSAYDIFRTRFVFHPETGDICQRFDGKVDKVYVETLSDEAFEQRKQEIRKPYEIIDHPLYRIYLIKTSTAQYLYADFYHAIVDGTAIVVIFWRELEKRYVSGTKSRRQPPSYAAYILEEAGIPKEELEEGHTYWRNELRGFEERRHLPPRDVEGVAAWTKNEIEIPMQVDMPKHFFKGRDFTENTFFMAASMLALAKTAGVRESVMSWVHNGRAQLSEMRLLGIMLEQFPIRWDFEENISVGQFLQGLEERVNSSMNYRKSLDIVYNEGLEEDCATFILQKGSMGRRGSMKFGNTVATIVEMPENEISAAENTLDIEMNAHDDGTYSLVLNYDASRYSEEAMRHFADTVEKMIHGLMEDGCMTGDLLK